MYLSPTRNVDGKMARDLVLVDTAPGSGSGTPDNATIRTLTELLSANPGIGSRQFELSAHERGVSHNRTRRFLKEEVKSGKIQVNQVGKKLEHFLSDGYDR